MPDSTATRSSAVDALSEGVTILEIIGRSYFLVSESRARSSLGPSLAEALGFGDSPAPCRCAVAPGSADYCLWYSRHRWFLNVAEDRAADLIRRLEAAAATRNCVAYDVTGGLKGLSVAGKTARRLLSKGCLVNLDEAAFPPGAGTRTFFIQDGAFIVRPTEQSAFEVFYDGSLDYAVTAWCNQVLGRAAK